MTEPESIEEMIGRVWQLTDKLVAAERERGIRHGLKVIGCLPRTIDLVVEREREWIETGAEDEQ